MEMPFAKEKALLALSAFFLPFSSSCSFPALFGSLSVSLCIFQEENAKTSSTIKGEHSGTRGSCNCKQVGSSDMDSELTLRKEQRKNKIGLAEAWATVRFLECSIWSDGGL